DDAADRHAREERRPHGNGSTLDEGLPKLRDPPIVELHTTAPNGSVVLSEFYHIPNYVTSLRVVPPGRWNFRCRKYRATRTQLSRTAVAAHHAKSRAKIVGWSR